MPPEPDRKQWMGLLARAKPADLAVLWDETPAHDWLRPPEAGAVMVQGRMGGTGAPFNLGEMTVTRCALRLATGEVGHAYVQGRDKAHARRAALIDALMQGPRAAELRVAVLEPLAAAMAAAAEARAAKAAATRVEFFTLVRGEELMQAEALSGGFADPAEEAARAFRAILNAMARPGVVERVAGAAPPAPLSVAAGVALLVLADRTTPLYLAPSHDVGAVRDWITFHCGAPFAPAAEAAFALGDWAGLQPLDRFPAGTPEYPDRSATLIVEVTALAPATHRLTGPGIRDSATLRLPGARPASRFPLGLDLILTCGDALAGLPRATLAEAL